MGLAGKDGEGHEAVTGRGRAPGRALTLAAAQRTMPVENKYTARNPPETRPPLDFPHGNDFFAEMISQNGVLLMGSRL